MNYAIIIALYAFDVNKNCPLFLSEYDSLSKNITPLPPESKIQYNTLYLSGKEVCKRDEKTSSLLVLIKNCFTVGALRLLFVIYIT